MLVDGTQAAEIAERSYVSLSTVRSHVKSILAKLGVRSQLAAVSMAKKAGWSVEAEVGTSDRGPGVAPGETGAVSAEYILLTVLVGVFMILAVGFFGDSLLRLFQFIFESLPF
jgi:Flp pilus assembly pilin Flp